MFKLKDILLNDHYHLVSHNKTIDKTYKEVYACDLLSAVIKHGKNNPILITQINSVTTIGVAVMLDLPAVILTENKKFNKETIKQADIEDIALIQTQLTSTEVMLDLIKRSLL
ncbi:hypothetical protein KHQ89_02965 [Mycoplasmatota bacterium]|nr:hypothetical protein KHQ89_02965 [Mycoplasmatota bacterium]